MRCTAKAHRTGAQCRRYARAGYAVCGVHGAGYSRKPGGRPLVHGKRSKYAAEVMERIARRTRNNATAELDRRLTRVLIQHLGCIGRALDAQIAQGETDANGLDMLVAEGNVTRELGRLSCKLTAVTLDWLREDTRARLLLYNDQEDR
ncbi:MAG: hypothetical protein EPO21_18060 [Chloroflexota bacterium]|nr:MAG: hypothetical protein EPO21_18060 [Chloroflexota bacterium]